MTKEAGLTALGVEAIQFHPGQEQVDLSVEIEVPGSWFNGTAIGSLTLADSGVRSTRHRRSSSLKFTSFLLQLVAERRARRRGFDSCAS